MKINKYNIGKRREKLNRVRKQLESTQLRAFHNLLPNRRIRKIRRDKGDASL